MPAEESELIALNEKRLTRPRTTRPKEEVIAELELFHEYIDRAREMHPYARAEFYELLIEVCEGVLGFVPPEPPVEAPPPSTTTEGAEAPTATEVHTGTRSAPRSHGKK
jgi:hypothetical protein